MDLNERRPDTLRDVDRNLFLACKVNKPGDAREALAAGAEVNTINRHGDSPLLCATWKAGAEIINLLLDHGAVLAPELADEIPPMEQVRPRVKGNPELAAALGRLGYRFTPQDIEMTFFDHVVAGNTREVLQALAERPERLVETDGWGAIPLLVAAMNRHLELARRLLDLDSPRDLPGGYPEGTPLMHALWNQDEPMARLLVERGADVDAHCHHCICTEPEIPVHIAAAQGLVWALELLVAHGADLSPLHEERTVLETARWYGWEKAVAWLERQVKS